MATRKSVIGVAVVTRDVGEGKSPFITVGCVPCCKLTEFLDKGHSGKTATKRKQKEGRERKGKEREKKKGKEKKEKRRRSQTLALRRPV